MFQQQIDQQIGITIKNILKILLMKKKEFLFFMK